MSDEIEIINDGEGVAILGDPAVVEQYLSSVGLESKELPTRRLGASMSAAAGIAQAGSGIAASSGRWVKLTEKSAAALKQSTLMKGSSTGVSRAVLTENGGKIKGILEIVQTPASILTNPAMLAGVSGIMAQVAMQQAMDEINDYLAVIDAKVDDVLRAQENAVLADMIGVDLILAEAMTLREHTGRVSDVTWSKVQSTSFSIARTQAYALGEIKGISEKLEKQVQVGEIASLSATSRAKVLDWLAVLARCCALQDGIAVLELDRVLDSSPEDLETHRSGVLAARRDRVQLIVRSTQSLLERVDAASQSANTKVLLHPVAARTVVQVGNHVTRDVLDFQLRLGVDGERGALEARRWRDAVGDVRDRTMETGMVGVAVAAKLGNDTVGRTRSMTGRAAGGAARRLARLRGGDQGEQAVEKTSEDPGYDE
ncbi:hypothetical protein Sked_19570 [Sanguibacter keddieii DSM 10542]|uniref:Uncharacterized protein n=1 Tax=Sanguibacter keddieii (strain ATCC 51767 / DSM 10542 / NCFB 3025 / ST-74) TaxID=446469 RepID=D1BHG2_SANKS|nr:hypothetical protein [Sanguibacter keddieii]ACZ21882.1 hypothetical protein Sked_19570 [Sanguibacter keddieii DSM 10542]